MEEVILEVGIRKERRQERGQHPKEDGGTSWGGGQGTPSHPRVSPGQRGWWRCLTSHNLGDLWSKGGNKQAYHGTERQDIERQSSLHSSGLLLITTYKNIPVYDSKTTKISKHMQKRQ